MDTAGFPWMNGPEKKALLGANWNAYTRSLGPNVSDKQLEEMKHEYYAHFYNKLEFTQTEDGKVYSQFTLKEIASQVLVESEQALKRSKRSLQGAVKIGDKKFDFTGEREGSWAGYTDADIDVAQKMAVDDSGVVNYFRGLMSLQAHEYMPVAGGVVDGLDLSYIYKLSQKENRTKQEDRVLQAYSLKQASDQLSGDLSTAYNAGAMTGKSLAFMGEVVLTSGIYTGVKTAAKEGIEKVLKKQVKKRVGAQLGDVIKKSGGRRIKTSVDDLITKDVRYKISSKAAGAVAFIAATGAQTAANPQRYITGTFENMTPEIAFAYTDQ